MRKLALGATVAAATGLLAVPVIGLAGSTGTTPTAAADDLPAFDDCDELLAWYVDRALPQVGPWGFGGGYAIAEDGVMLRGSAETAVDDVASGAPSEPVYSSKTGTNVQEGGVDEPDVAKTDGSVVVQVNQGDLVVTDVTGDRPVELSRTGLPKDFGAAGLLLAGDRVLVTGSRQQGLVGDRLAPDSIYPYPHGFGNSQVLTYSIADPGDPERVADQEYEGELVEARQYGDTVRLVVRTGVPPLDFVQPNRRRSDDEARRENRRIVRESTIEDWLPMVEDDGATSRLVDCQDVRHPRTDSGFGTITIVTFDADTPRDRSTVAVATSGSLAYSSTDRLYVATPVHRGFDDCIDCGFWGKARIEPVAPPETEVHAFALDSTSTRYVASGKVGGTVRDRWSFDEHDGFLRVATALSKNWQTTDNAVTVLRERGDDLDVVGSVRGIGPNEEIKSVRWFDDFAVVVTFRQMDPLYTIDLTVPAKPRVLGELKIPGFSSYLHPIGGDRLLGLGTAATNQGVGLGAQLATFDISRLSDPRQLSVLRLGQQQELLAGIDPHAFTFVGASRAFTTVTSWDGRASILELVISPAGKIRKVAEHPSSYEARALPLGADRVALAGDVVRLLDVR